MKTKMFAKLLILSIVISFSTGNLMAQDESARPAYIAVTKMHWNMELEDFDMAEWKATEQEFLEKVTKKNEYIMGSSFHMHKYTPDNSELMYVRVYKSWEDIEKAQDRDGELIMEAWPNKDTREAFLKKQENYYSMEHSDEIYVPVGMPKHVPESYDGKDMITYLRIGKLAYPEDGSMEEFNNLNNQFIQKVIMNNDAIKGYYPHVHGWGSDRRDYLEAYVVESMGDLENLREDGWEIAKKQWPDETKRQEFFESYNKYFLPIHEDYIYTSIGGLSK